MKEYLPEGIRFKSQEMQKKLPLPSYVSSRIHLLSAEIYTHHNNYFLLPLHTNLF